VFLKRVTNRKNGKRHTYWALVESIRTARGPRHRTVAYLGELGASEQAGWADVRRLLEGIPVPSPGLFDGAESGVDPIPEHVKVKVREIEVEGTCDFGDVYLGWVLWRALRLDELLSAKIPTGREEVSWPVVAAVLALSRFCEPSSKLHIEDTWYCRTALEDLLGVPADQVNTDRLYRGLDEVLPHKEAIERHLKERFATLFDVQFDLILYDVTSTYFEGLMKRNPQAKRGHSRDKRPDCLQVCIALLVTREGLPIGYEVFAGNRNDMTTMEEIVEGMERKHGSIGRVWVVDRGIASEKNLEFLRKRGASYVVGTPKSALKRFEQALLEDGWSEVEGGVEVKSCAGPDGRETFVLCRSAERGEKEKAMHERFAARIQKAIEKLAGRLERARKKVDPGRVHRQIGRLLGQNSRAAGAFEIKVEEAPERGSGLKVSFARNAAWSDWARLSEGSYLLRTNLVDWSPQDLWKTYIQLTQAESAFRIQKTELSIRPIRHHREDRAQAHILFSFLAYAMWKTLEQWMARSGLGNGPRTIVEEFARIKLVDMILPTSTGRKLKLKCISNPDQGQRIILRKLGLELPRRLGHPRWAESLEAAAKM
jgi:transposase